MLTDQKRLLILDDLAQDPQLAEYFVKFNFQIVQYSNLSQLENEKELPSALLVNSRLIEKDATILETLYQRYPTPLLVISDTSNEAMCIRMLEAGADDFLVKPIHPRELHARISAITRRVQRSNQTIADQERAVFLFAGLRLYPASRRILDENEQELLLSVGEYDLLLAFVRQPQQVLKREFLLQITKHSDLTSCDRRIDVQISRLRQKIETDSRKPALIKTIRNGGYLFTAQVTYLKETNE